MASILRHCIKLHRTMHFVREFGVSVAELRWQRKIVDAVVADNDLRLSDGPIGR